MIPRILFFLALTATVVGLSVSLFRLVARAIDKRRSVFAAKQKQRATEMGPAEREFRSRELARKSRRAAVAELGGGVVLTGFGAYGTFEIVLHLVTGTFADFLQREGSFLFFAAPFILGYGVYLSVANIATLRKKK